MSEVKNETIDDIIEVMKKNYKKTDSKLLPEQTFDSWQEI